MMNVFSDPPGGSISFNIRRIKNQNPPPYGKITSLGALPPF